MRDPTPQETKKFERALTTAFGLEARIETFEIRRRLKTADESLCAGIGEEG